MSQIRNGKREITFKTLIYQAIDIGDVKILQLCLDHGANLYFRSYPGNVHFIDEAKYDSYEVCGIRKCFSHKLLYRLANRGIDFTDLEVPALSLIHYPYSKETYTDPSRWSRLVRHLLKLNVSTEIDIVSYCTIYNISFYPQRSVRMDQHLSFSQLFVVILA